MSNHSFSHFWGSFYEYLDDRKFTLAKVVGLIKHGFIKRNKKSAYVKESTSYNKEYYYNMDRYEMIKLLVHLEIDDYMFDDI